MTVSGRPAPPAGVEPHAEVPLVDLKAQYRGIREEVRAAIDGVLDGMQLTVGPNVRAFEAEFAAYCGTKHAIGVGSGTDALMLPIRALGIGPGDEVITVSFTFFATVEAILYSGARPVLVDVDERTMNIDLAAVERAITPKTKAIIPVHLYGRSADMGPLLALAGKHGLIVIEDAAQAHGALLEDGKRKAGSAGRAGCFSFYCSKNLGAYGEAGGITTDDDALAETLRSLREHGQRERYLHPLVGYNARLDEIQAAILRIKLRKLPEWTDQRRARAKRYGELLAGAGVKTPALPAGDRHVMYAYVIRVPGGKRNALRAHLGERGIGTQIHYPVPIHLQDATRSLGYRKGELPVTERLADEVLSIPMYPELTDAQQQHVAGAIRDFMKR